MKFIATKILIKIIKFSKHKIRHIFSVFSTLSKELWVTLKNTAKWQISSYALTSMTSAFSNAFVMAFSITCEV